MDENLKLDVQKHLINEVDPSERLAVKNTFCVLFAKKYANSMKEIHFFSSDCMGDDEDYFQMDYNVEYTNGEHQNRNCMIETKDVLLALGFANYEALRDYFIEKYNDNENAWDLIVKEMKEKGLSPDVDKNEGNSYFMTDMS